MAPGWHLAGSAALLRMIALGAAGPAAGCALPRGRLPGSAPALCALPPPEALPLLARAPSLPSGSGDSSAMRRCSSSLRRRSRSPPSGSAAASTAARRASCACMASSAAARLSHVGGGQQAVCSLGLGDCGQTNDMLTKATASTLHAGGPEHPSTFSTMLCAHPPPAATSSASPERRGTGRGTAGSSAAAPSGLAAAAPAPLGPPRVSCRASRSLMSPLPFQPVTQGAHITAWS